jgi:hypothetical protein
LADGQVEELERDLSVKLDLPAGATISKQTTESWEAIARQIYAAVVTGAQTARVDIFNGNFGLNRGIGTAILILLLALLGRDVVQGGISNIFAHWTIVIALIVADGLSWYRMRRFAKAYARELLVQSIQMPPRQRADHQEQ